MHLCSIVQFDLLWVNPELFPVIALAECSKAKKHGALESCFECEGFLCAGAAFCTN